MVAGLTAGAAATIRPYDTVLFAVPLLAWAVLGPLRGGGVRAAVRLIAGAALPLVALLLFDVVATGHPFRLPFNALERRDSLGFGVRKLYPTDRSHHFGVVQGLAGIGDHVKLLVWWTAGGGLLIVAGVVAGVRRRLPAPVLALVGSAILLLVGYVGFWGAWNADDLWGGIRYIGPFYVLPVLLPVVLCGARGLIDLWDARRCVAALAGIATVTAAAVVLTFAVRDNLHFTSQDRQLAHLVDLPGRSVVFVATSPSFLMHPSAVLSNPPLDKTDRARDPARLFALSRGVDDFRVLADHPGRSLWYLQISQASGKRLHRGESGQLRRLRLLQGPRIALTVASSAPARTARLQLVVAYGSRQLTYELPAAGGSVPLSITPEGVSFPATAAAVEKLTKPVPGLQITLLRISGDGGPARVLSQQRLSTRRSVGEVQLLLPGPAVGAIGAPGRSWLSLTAS